MGKKIKSCARKVFILALVAVMLLQTGGLQGLTLQTTSSGVTTPIIGNGENVIFPMTEVVLNQSGSSVQTLTKTDSTETTESTEATDSTEPTESTDSAKITEVPTGAVPFPSDFSADAVESEYSISTTEEFILFARASRTYSFTGVTIHLAADIDYNDGYEDISFQGIGTSSTPFCGTFDGHGYTISNVFSNVTGVFHFIGSTENPVTIRNLTVDSATIKGAEGRAVLVSRFMGNPKDTTKNNLIENVTVSNSTGSFTGNNCGILVGRCNADDQAITISGCTVTNCDLICTESSTANRTQWGIIIGKDRSLGYSKILNCKVSGCDIISTDCNVEKVGLVAGILYGPTQVDGCEVISSTISTGLATATLTQDLGGIVGRLQSSAGAVRNCSVGAVKIAAQGACQNVGLIAGRTYGSTFENNSVNSSSIHLLYAEETGLSNAIGGMIGFIGGGVATIDGCKANRITFNGAALCNGWGGMVGTITADAAGTVIRNSSVSNSYITSTYASTTLYGSYVGGIVGNALGKISGENVSSVNVSISAQSLLKAVGGFVGYISGTEGSQLTGCDVTMGNIYTSAYNDTAGYECAHISGFAGCVDSPSVLTGCIVENTFGTMGGRSLYLGGLIGSTYSDLLLETPVSGAVTVDRCAVINSALETTQNRYCSKIGGLVGYLAEGSSVSDCYVYGFTGPRNTNSLHAGGIIAYIPKVSGEATLVKNCYARDITLSGKNLISETIGNCVAENATMKSLWYYNCTMNRGTGGEIFTCPGTIAGSDSSFTSGETAWSLNTANGTQSNSYLWTQGTDGPVWRTGNGLGTVRVTFQTGSGNVYRYTGSDGYISSIPAAASGYEWESEETYFTVDTVVTAKESGAFGTAFPDSMTSAPTASEYYIENLTQLKSFQTASKSYDFAGITIHLAADLDWGGSAGGNWGGIGKSADISFCGTFEGHDHTISNLYSTSTGLFLIMGTTDHPATVKNLTISNAQISGAEGKAIVVSRINGNPASVSKNSLISNVHVVNSAASFTGNNCGVIVGRGQTGDDAVTIEGCTVTGTTLTCTASTTTNPARWGIIIGRDYSNGYSRINNCKVTDSDIVSTDCNLTHVGIIGGLISGATKIEGCTVDGCSISTGLETATLTEGLGGIVGCLQSGFGQISDCSVTDTTITTKGLCAYVGLIAGRIYGGLMENNTVSDSTINGLYNATNSQSSRVGGVFGCVSDNVSRIYNCSAKNVTINNASRFNSYGGLIGNVESSAAGTIIKDCAVTDLVIANTYSTNSANSFYLAGAIGRCAGKVHITNVSVSGAQLTLATLVQGMGGFTGYISGSEPSVLTDCSVSNVSITQTQSPLDDTYMCYHVGGFVGCVDTDSKLAGCSVKGTTILMQGRTYYMGGLVGSTYSDQLKTTPVHGMVTVKNCQVTGSSLTTKQSRNCNEFGGLIGWLSEGGTVVNCFVSGMTNPSNTNSIHVGGLIGYIPESNSDSVDTTVKNCYVEGCTLNGKTALSATIGNAVASGEVFTNNYYYNCTLNGGTESGASGATKATSGLTDGTLVTSLNTTNGAAANTKSWVQGSTGPILNSSRSGSTTAKVVSFNVYYLTQNDSYPIANRQSKVIDLIDRCYDEGVGVFGLQEVTGIWYNYINNYVKNTNTNLVWSGYGRYGGTFGGFASGSNATNDSFNLILYDKTRYDKTDEGHFWLSDTPDSKSLFYDVAYNYRVVNWVRLRDKTTGEEFVFCNAHLEDTKGTAIVNDWGYTIDSSCGPTARVKQAQVVCNEMNQHATGLPVVIVGDWNSYNGTDGYSTIISNGYQDLRKIAETADSCGSYNAWTRTDTSKFSFGDHIVANGLCTAILYDVLTDEDVDSATGYHISDHSPLYAEIRY